MITLNQNQFVALSFEELMNTFGGLDPEAWAALAKRWIKAVGDVLVTGLSYAGAVVLGAYGLDNIINGK